MNYYELEELKQEKKMIDDIFLQTQDCLDNMILIILQSYEYKFNDIESEKEQVLMILDIYLDVCDKVFKSFLCSKKIKEIFKRIKVDYGIKKFNDSILSLEESAKKSLISAASFIDLPLPRELKYGEVIDDFETFQKELRISKISNDKFFEEIRASRKEKFNYALEIEELKDVINGDIERNYTQEEYNKLLDKSFLYEILDFFGLDDEILVRIVNTCNDRYEAYLKEKELKKSLTRKSIKEEVKKLDLKETNIGLDDIDLDVIDENVNVLENVNSWLEFLRDGVDPIQVYEILNERNNEWEISAFYESLKNELSFLKNDLIKVANSKDDFEKITLEIRKFEKYISLFEDFFSKDEEINSDVTNNLFFASKGNGTYFSKGLTNIQNDFQRVSAIKCLKVMKNGSKKQILSHSKPINIDGKKDMFEYKTYGIRLLYRILGRDSYFIIDVLEKKSNRDNGYVFKLKRCYESTSREYLSLKERLMEIDSFELQKQNNIYSEVIEDFNLEK